MNTGHTPAPAWPLQRRRPKAAAKEGELSDEVDQGTRKDKMAVGKIDPPAAFNLEDIQNFPEERLTPVLNNPITFEEGRDFSTMMESQDEKLIHPWLPEIPRAPFLSMKPSIDKPAKDWTFSVIDQGGTPVASQDGQGKPPVPLHLVRGTTRTAAIWPWTPSISPSWPPPTRKAIATPTWASRVQFAVLYYKDKGARSCGTLHANASSWRKRRISRRKLPCSWIRSAISSGKNPGSLSGSRPMIRTRTWRGPGRTLLQKYFSEKLYHPVEARSRFWNREARKSADRPIAVVFNATPGGAQIMKKRKCQVT